MRKIDDPVFVVDADGELISATGVGSKQNVAIRSDNPELVKAAKQAADLNVKVDFIWGARPLIAGWDSEEGILAALLAAKSGRSFVVEAPESVLKVINELSGPQQEGIIY